MKDSTTSQEDDESEDEGLEEVLSGAHNLEQATLILSLYVMVFLPTSLFLDTLEEQHLFLRKWMGLLCVIFEYIQSYNCMRCEKGN